MASNQPFNIDERIRSGLTDILESHGVGEPDYHVSLNGTDVATIKQLFRDFYEYVKLGRNVNGYGRGEIIMTDQHNKVDVHQAARWAATDYNSAIDEMDTKAKECGL